MQAVSKVAASIMQVSTPGANEKISLEWASTHFCIHSAFVLKIMTTSVRYLGDFLGASFKILKQLKMCTTCYGGAGKGGRRDKGIKVCSTGHKVLARLKYRKELDECYWKRTSSCFFYGTCQFYPQTPQKQCHSLPVLGYLRSSWHWL